MSANPLLRNMGGSPRIYDDVEPLKKKASVKKFLDGLKDGPGRNTALYSLARFLRWRKSKRLEDDPDALIAQCRNGTQNIAISHLEELIEYAQGLSDCEKSTKVRNYKVVRGFYEKNLITLPRMKLKASDTVKANGVRTVAVKAKAERPAEEFLNMTRKALNYAGVRDRSVILSMLQGGMDASTLAEIFNYVAFPQLTKHFGTDDWREWDTNRCPARVDLVRPKSEYQFYTYSDVDAIEALKEWMNVRTTEFGLTKIYQPDDPSDLPTSDPIYVDGDGSPMQASTVTEIFRNVGKRAGINKSNGHKPGKYKGARLRYPFHSHECRDVMITLARGKVDIAIPKFLTGHCIDDLGYDKSPLNDPEHFRSEYLKIARPALNPVSGRILEVEREVTARLEERLARIEAQMAERLSAHS
jgi:hypothetical protein